MLHLRDWARCNNRYDVTDLGGIPRVMHKIFLGAHEIFLVLRVLYIAVDLNRGCVLHRRLDDSSDEDLGTDRFLLHGITRPRFFANAPNVRVAP